MIPAGRVVIDQAGIGELHGLTPTQAKRAKPWAADGHPPPLTTRRPSNGYPRLWDHEQAQAFALGSPVPSLSGDTAVSMSGYDLLDRFEAAELAGVHPEAWRADWYHERGVPDADEQPYRVPHWYRSTVEEYREQRARPRTGPHPGGRPPGSPPRRAPGELRSLIRNLLQEAEAAGTRLTIADVARTADVHYSTAHQHVTALRKDTSET